MRIAFLASDKPREQLLADAFLMGAREHGHTTSVHALQPEPFVGEYDVACMVGVKSRELWRMHKRAGVPVIYLDKGYCRQKRTDGIAGWEYWRVSINEHHPTSRLSRWDAPTRRLDSLGLDLKPYREVGEQIVLAGSSAKYHDFYSLPEPTTFARRIIRGLMDQERPIIYRPKPSWADAVPIRHSHFSRPPELIGDVLQGAWCLVTHGSNACFEAVVAGIPCVVLGDAPARPISSTEIEAVIAPRIPTEAERRTWLANLAWWQWTAAEMASGEAWDFIGRELHRGS